MKSQLCLTFRFLQPFPQFHGRRDGDLPEWPPSPMRAFQSLLNAASICGGGRTLAPTIRQALQTLEAMQPHIIAPRAEVSPVGYRMYVPHNQTDLVTAGWHRGHIGASIAEYRMEKDIRPMRIEQAGEELPALHYLYTFDESVDPNLLLRSLRPSVRSITHLGWGIDQVVADATLVEQYQKPSASERWIPSKQTGKRLRVHRKGSLEALARRHDNFLNRLQGGWTPVPPLVNGTEVDQINYRRDCDPSPRPHAVFKLIDENDDTVAYPHSKLIHIAGMVRHIAKEQMKLDPPRDLRGRSTEEWIDQYVAGHKPRDSANASQLHEQFSFIPLPSTGMQHTDPGIRRVMIVAPAGDDAWLEDLAQQLDGQLLKPESGTVLPSGTHLRRVTSHEKDGVRKAYTGESQVWASFTPVILPGHDDHKPEKTRKLILKALAQSGIEQPCEFEWSAYSHFSKSFSAHKYKYVRDESVAGGKRPIGYIRPDHMREQTAVHLRLTFEQPMPGPIALGAGRHCGFGLMAAV